MTLSINQVYHPLINSQCQNGVMRKVIVVHVRQCHMYPIQWAVVNVLLIRRLPHHTSTAAQPTRRLQQANAFFTAH